MQEKIWVVSDETADDEIEVDNDDILDECNI
jgi:hypothetical protein